MKRWRVRYYYRNSTGVLADESPLMTKQRAAGIVEHIRICAPARRAKHAPAQITIEVGPGLSRRQRIRLRGLVDIELVRAGKPSPLKHKARLAPNLAATEIVEQTKLSKPMKRALEILEKRGGSLAYTTLRKLLKVSSPSLSRTVDRLAERGLASRSGAGSALLVVLAR